MRGEATIESIVTILNTHLNKLVRDSLSDVITCQRLKKWDGGMDGRVGGEMNCGLLRGKNDPLSPSVISCELFYPFNLNVHSLSLQIDIYCTILLNINDSKFKN